MRLFRRECRAGGADGPVRDKGVPCANVPSSCPRDVNSCDPADTGYRGRGRPRPHPLLGRLFSERSTALFRLNRARIREPVRHLVRFHFAKREETLNAAGERLLRLRGLATAKGWRG